MKPGKLATHIALSIAVMIGVAGCGSSTDGKSDGSEIVIGVLENAAPFGAKNTSNGKYEGFDVDMAHYIAGQVYGDDTKVKLVGVGKDSRIPLLQGGDIDLLLATLTITDERKKVVDFSNPYFPSPLAVMVRRDSGIEDLSGLKGETYCVPQGSAVQPIFEAGAVGDPALEPLMSSFGRTELPTPADCLLALRQKRGVGFVINDYATLGAQVSDADDVKLLEDVAIGEELNLFGVALKKGNADLAKVNDAICASFEDGTWSDLYKKWIRVDPPAGWPKSC